jgi:N-acetylglucosaminyl-diphospho-decaprenol L-rhamnosyltransferase
VNMTGIVIITYNSRDAIGPCLESCLKLPNVQLLVVDNNSTDGTVEEVKRRNVPLLANATNRGFAAAANQGFALLDTEHVLLLNPDCEISGSIEGLITALGSPDVAAAGGCLLHADGSVQNGFNVRSFPTGVTLAFEVLGLNRIWPGNAVNHRYRMRPSTDAVSQVDQPAGAFLMIKRAAWKQLGGFDEQFHPIWFEDVDFCRRLLLANYRIVYVPGAVAKHIGGHSTKQISWELRELYWYGSLLRYAAKHYKAGERGLVSLAVMAACIPRTAVGALSHRTLRSVSVYSRVMWLAALCLMGAMNGEVGAPQDLAVKPAHE